MEQFFFIILVAVVGLVRLISSIAENRRNAEAGRQAKASSNPEPTLAAPRQPAQTEEERVRKFLEALGVPAGEVPPPRRQPRTVAPQAPPAKRTFLPVDPFPAPRRRAGLPPLPSPPPLPPVVSAPPP